MATELFTEAIVDYTIKNDITINQLASKLNISCSTLSRWINSEFTPSIKDVKIVSNFLNISADYLFGLSDCTTISSIDNSLTFAEKLKKLLMDSNISSYKLAKDCNFQKSAVSKWLNNQREPRIVNVVEIAEYFNCSIDYLIS